MKDEFEDGLLDVVSASDNNASEQSIELIANIAEYSIDRIISDDALKEIPWEGWLSKIKTAYQSISDGIFIKKLYYLLHNLDKIRSSEVNSISYKINKDPVYRKRVGEQLFLLLDKTENYKKTKFIAQCFDHFLTGDLDESLLFELIHMINGTTLSDLILFKKDYRWLSSNEQMRLASSSITAYHLTDEVIRINKTKPNETKPMLDFKITEHGKILYQVLNDEYREELITAKKRSLKETFA